MKEFKNFKVIDLYPEITRGKRLTKADRTDGKIPLVTAGEEHYGIADYIEKHSILNRPNSLTIDMFGNVFYRDYEYFSDDNIISLANVNFTKYVNLYIAGSLQKISQSYNYSNQFRMKSLEKTEISLPVTSDGSPDYAYMEDYIKGVQRQYIDNLLETNEAERNRLLSIVGLSLGEYERVKGTIELCDAKNYGEFKVGDLFEIENCKAYHKDSLVITENPKGINYVTRTTYNNAIECKVELNETLSVNKGNSIIFGAESARFFYQNDDYITGNKVYKIHADNFNKNLCLYLVSCLNKTIETMGFGYSNGLVPSRANEIIIQLPTTPTGEVDYAYMEDYISKIKLIYIYNRELSINEQIRLLEAIIKSTFVKNT